MKKRMFLAFLFTFSFTALQAQIKGKIVDEENNPIAFANVVLYGLPDSLFLTGEVSDNAGNFIIHSDRVEHTFLKVSFIGYDTQVLPTRQMQIIQLKPTVSQLDEIVVHGQRPIYQMEANGLHTNIEHTSLSRLGTASDVLSQLPFLNGENGEFTVFGRGAPSIYINNRLVRDNDELMQLKSSEIKEVKVILNPGTEHESSVGSVIRITTLKPVGEGLSGSLFASIRQRRRFDQAEYVNFNYRKGKLDAFAKINYTHTVNRQNQKDETRLDLKTAYITKNDKIIKSKTTSWDATTGLNYTFSPVHSIGIRYNYKRMPESDWNINGQTYHFVNNTKDADLLAAKSTEMKSLRHYLNTYYHAEFTNKSTLHFEGDYIKGNRFQDEFSDNINRKIQSRIQIKSTNKTDYSLYAGKLVASLPVFGGRTTFGGEGSYTENAQDFSMLDENISTDLPSTYSKSRQALFATFLSFERSWQRVSLQAGLRYEYVDFKYYYNNIYQDNQSRNYNNWFPTFSLAYHNGPIQMSLNSRTTVRRPTYFNLRSSVSYNNPYTYEGGNPTLKPMYTHKLTYLFGWKGLEFEVSYQWIKDNLLFVAEQFKDQSIILLTMKNLRYSQRVDAYVSYSHTWGIWKPTWEVGLNKQHLTYQNRTYNSPYCSYRWNNLFQLPKDFQLSLTMWGALKGHSDVSLNRAFFRTDMKLNKSFFANTLDFTIHVTDIFATSREKWSMQTGIVYFDKWNDSDRRGINLQVTYKFNASRSKYKGQGAAASELNRL